MENTSYFKKNVHYLCKVNKMKVSYLLTLLKLPKNYNTTIGLVLICDYFNIKADSVMFKKLWNQ